MKGSHLHHALSGCLQTVENRHGKQTWKTIKPSNQKVAPVIYEMWMFMRGSNYGALIGKFRVF